MSSCCEGKQSQSSESSSLSIALVGNPNCGKTTLFNALTGSRQRIGNWPGVTVERKKGYFSHKNKIVEVTDLPGVYALTLSALSGAVDERIAVEFILQHEAKVLVNIVDASNLERHLYLTMQLIEMGAPIILALNMMDVARARGIQIDIKRLERKLNCPVIAVEANREIGLEDLKKAIHHYQQQIGNDELISYSDEILEAIEKISAEVSIENNISHQDGSPLSQGRQLSHLSLGRRQTENRSLALRLLEDDVFARKLVDERVLEIVKAEQQNINNTLQEDADILIADARYQFVQQLIQTVTKTTKSAIKSWTNRIDDIVLNRVLSLPIFLAVMYSLFFFSINIGGAFQDFFDKSSQTIFVDGLSYWLSTHGSPTWLTVLLANGVGKGINTTITFIPVIGAMFLFLAFLEDSGYMARAAFVIDRLMRAVGLPGKAFVPMIVGFGCNVPAVMGARTLENKRDRILTIMMAPFMSCGARLAIFAVFTAAFFPHGGQNIVFALYLIGILMAIFTGFLLQKTVLKGEPSPLVMELPAYHMPHFKTLMLHAWQRLKGFVFRAGKLIVPICVLIGALNSLNVDGTINSGDGDAHSLLSTIGQWVTPIFSPMGIRVDNWPATVGLVTGILAKEVVVGTLNALYTQVGHLNATVSTDTFSLVAGLKAAWQSIPDNLLALKDAFVNPVLAKAPMDTVNQGVYGLMYQKFDGQIGAFAYLLFVLLYFPCVSTTAAMLRELHRGWSIFSVLWMTGVAYSVAVLFYQTATLLHHPVRSLIWIVAIVATFLGTIGFVKHVVSRTSLQKNQVIGDFA